MPILLSHMTAADFWRRVYSPDKSPAAVDCPTPRTSLAHTSEDIWCLTPRWITPDFLSEEGGIVHVTVCDRNERGRSNSHLCHLWQAPFPERSFYQVSENVYVASPAFTYLQLAQSLALPQLIAYGNELCGLYSFNGGSERGFRQRSTPLVNIGQLHQIVDEARGVHGRAKARRALGWIVEGSASPLETSVEMLLCLPYRLGGYGLPSPTMNHKVQLSNESANIAHRKFIKADICWPNSRIDLEYHGQFDHAGVKALHSDRARTNALSIMGYTVIEITAQQVYDLGALESIARELGKMLDKRIAREYRGALPKRMALREELFNWNRANGRLKTE